ncbi:hypothetical protein [Wolbachia endosymbiont of Nomada panzeri]|nr:hypothetical protein [Wolbachia endosymbiont of Nomada panzeri]
MRKIQVSRYLDDTYNLVIPVLPPLSSQCVTLGSRNFDWTTSW